MPSMSVVAGLLPQRRHGDRRPAASSSAGSAHTRAAIHESRVHLREVSADLRAQPCDEARAATRCSVRPDRVPRARSSRPSAGALIHVSMRLPPHVVLTMPIGTSTDLRRSRAKKYPTALKRPDVRRVRDRPRAAGEVGLGRRRVRRRHLEVADARVVRRGDLALRRSACCERSTPCSTGPTRPTRRRRGCRAATTLSDPERTTSRCGPPARRAGSTTRHAPDGAAVARSETPSERDRDRGARRAPAPDGHAHVPLEHHALAEQCARAGARGVESACAPRGARRRRRWRAGSSGRSFGSASRQGRKRGGNILQ